MAAQNSVLTQIARPYASALFDLANAERMLPTQDGSAAFMPGRALKALRSRHHMTQVEVGSAAGMTGNELQFVKGSYQSISRLPLLFR